MIMRSGGTQAEHPMYEKVQTGMINPEMKVSCAKQE